MTINHEKKLIFIHVPKNAGTSIIEAMGVENIFIDGTIEEYRDHYHEYWNKYTKFAVIRDPIDRFISAYKFARMDESGWFSASGEEGLEKHIHYELCNELDINKYVKYIYDNKKEYNRWIIPQTFIISDKNGKMPLDYYVRYENLLKDLQKIGINSVKKLNSSKIENEQLIQLSKESKNMLFEIYDIDYKNFFYKKQIKNFFSYQ